MSTTVTRGSYATPVGRVPQPPGAAAASDGNPPRPGGLGSRPGPRPIASPGPDSIYPSRRGWGPGHSVTTPGAGLGQMLDCTSLS